MELRVMMNWPVVTSAKDSNGSSAVPCALARPQPGNGQRDATDDRQQPSHRHGQLMN